MSILTTMLVLMSSATLMAQVTVKGTLLEKGSNDPLMGITVMFGKTGTTTNVDGKFTLKVAKDATLTIRAVGFDTKTIKVGKAAEQDLGIIYLSPSAVGLQEVSVIASVVPKDRITPVPLSNVSIDKIETAAPNIEFPELLKSTPSVYVTKGGGGFGDSRINLRGFDSNNIGVLINGIPINDMESGKVYWSNWAGLSDVSSFIQVQRGLGASKLGLSSVGGTINMVTKSTDAKKGGSFYSGIGNDGYNKFTFNVSTGLMDNGWALTVAGARNGGNGYVNATSFLGWSYFINVSKVLNDAHRLSFTAFGAPQWHNQRGLMSRIEDIKNDPDRGRRNIGYGYINGKETTLAYNFYHKPQMSLNHYWDINEKSQLYTSVYASVARGGGRRIVGEKRNWMYFDRNTNLPTAETRLTNDGLIDYASIIADNRASNTGAKVIFANAINSHNWYGVLSTYNNKLSDRVKLTAGYDARFYQGIHRNVISDLLGADYYIEPQDPSKKLMYHAPYQALKVGDHVEYDNIGEVLWNGLFAQTEFTGERFNGFVSATLSHQGYRYRNLGGTAEPEALREKGESINSKWASYLPWSIKSGLSYKVNENNNLFVNAGYFTRAPYFRSVFFKYNSEINTGAKYEKVLTGEIGYGFRNENLKIDFNAYYTKWLDKGITRTLSNNEVANITGLNARHMGIELEATYNPFKTLELRGMLSLGDWIWSDDVDASIFDSSQTKIADIKAFIKGVHVGNSAQFTASLGANWEVFEGFKLNLNTNYFGKNYADFDPVNRTKESDKVDAWQLPNYMLVDLGASYKFKVGSLGATLYMNVDNLFDTEYIADARDGVRHDQNTALVYYGFGRTWATGLRINF